MTYERKCWEMMKARKAWKRTIANQEVNMIRKIWSKAKMDYQPTKKLQKLEVLWMRKICVFGATRESLPQIMVPEGGREAKGLLLAFWIFVGHCLTCYRKHKWKQTTRSSKQSILNQKRNTSNNKLIYKLKQSIQIQVNRRLVAWISP